MELAHLTKSDLVYSTRTRVAALIPCYNTQKYIANIIAKTKKYVDDVIVIDDGSTDSTADVARSAGAIVIRHPENQGKGSAMKTGMKNIDADVIVFIDGDGQHDPRDIPELLEPILQGKADFVIGSRYISSSKVSVNPFNRKVANMIASLTISIVISVMQPLLRFIGRNPRPEKTLSLPVLDQSFDCVHRHYRLLNGKFKRVSDCTSGFTAMRKQHWHRLNLISDGFQIETEIIFEHAKNGYKIAEIPICIIWSDSKSRLSIIKDGISTLFLLMHKLLNYSDKGQIE